ncbi:hypothetical protein [Rahnella perminowiae]|uniref:hypothetical protein n=2 Tax=Rahnella perminowiae TaxID=2816244 RepID=UPI00215BC48B|nr:hypothetical protein [Rahnella perminowiae]MCR9000968.1 hypothetical protein [Rahnella perminowiae]
MLRQEYHLCSGGQINYATTNISLKTTSYRKVALASLCSPYQMVVILVVLTEGDFRFSLLISQLLAKAIPVRGAKFREARLRKLKRAFCFFALGNCRPGEMWGLIEGHLRCDNDVTTKGVLMTKNPQF